MTKTTRKLFQKSAAMLLSICLISGGMTEASLLHVYAEGDDEITVSDITVSDSDTEESVMDGSDITTPPIQTR